MSEKEGLNIDASTYELTETEKRGLYVCQKMDSATADFFAATPSSWYEYEEEPRDERPGGGEGIFV